MAEDLEQLLAAGEYARVAGLARARLAAGGLPAAEEWGICRLLSRALSGLHDHKGAVEAALRAAELARQGGRPPAEQAWSLYELALARKGLRAIDQAVDNLLELLAILDQAGEQGPNRGEVLLHLGALQAEQGSPAAADAFQAARAWFTAAAQPHRAESARRELVCYLIRSNRTEAAAALLAEGDRYVAAHPEDQVAQTEHLLHRGRWALARNEYLTAAQLAEQALQAAGENAGLEFEAYMLIYHTACALGDPRGALKYALLARIITLRSHLYEQEFQATMAFIESRDKLDEAEGREILADMHREFLHRGIDIYQYLPETLFRKRA